MRENTLEEFQRRKIEFLIIFSAFLQKTEAQKAKWKTKLPQGNTGRVYIYEWDKETRFWLIVCPIISIVTVVSTSMTSWLIYDLMDGINKAVYRNQRRLRHFDDCLTIMNRCFTG